MTVSLTGSSLHLEEVVKVAHGEREVTLDPSALRRMEANRKALERIMEEGRVAYGINTGVGDFQNVVIPGERILELQRNLVRSTACGVGPCMAAEVVRAMMLLRVNALALGLSGVRGEVALQLVEMLNRGVVPVVPMRGSVGSSGDLVPLAHIAMVMMGEGEAKVGEELLPGDMALARVGLVPLELQAKEGLALINGTQYMVAVGSLCLHRTLRLLKTAQVAVAMSVDALRGTVSSFSDRVSDARPHEGQRRVARNLRSLLEGSAIVASHAGCKEVQDAYTLRCAPQVLGAVMDALRYVRGTLEVEMNSATDNPLVFEGGEVISGGNFHGEPVALALDHLCLAVHEIGSFSERRTVRLVDGSLSGLPRFLTRSQGIDSGMMIPQYVAASLVSETRNLCFPSTADNVPTSANQEDFNSMGPVAANKLGTIVDNAEQVVAIEMLCAAQALEFHQLDPGRGVRRAHEFVRTRVGRLVEDRSLSKEMMWLKRRIEDGSLIAWVEQGVPLV